MAKKKTTKFSKEQQLGIGVGITTAVVAAAGAYFLYGSKSAKENRGKIKSWMLKAKGEVLEAIEKASEMSESEFKAVVEKVAAGYDKAQTLSKKEVADFKKEMAANWQEIAAAGITAVAKSNKSPKKTAKKAAKKVAKKTATKAKKAAKKSAKKSSK